MIKKITCTVFLISFSLILFSQDLIIKKDSTKIYCKITKEDSSTIYYYQYKGRKPVDASISKLQVRKYFYAEKITQNNTGTKSPEEKQRFHFNLFAGGSNPVGVFASKNTKEETSGYANKGFVINASVVLKLSEFVGFECLYIYQKNSCDDKVIAQNLQAKYGGSFSSSNMPWAIKGFLGGFYITFPFGHVKNLYGEINVLAGMPTYTSAGLTITQKYSGGVVSENQDPDEANAFTVFTGFGLRYKFATNLYITGGIDFLAGKPYFENVMVTNKHSSYYTTVDFVNFAQFVKTYNVRTGLTYVLNGFKINLGNRKKISGDKNH